MSPNLLKILALFYVIYVIYLCYRDYRFREVKRRIVLLSYPFVLLMNWELVEFKLILVFSSLILFITLYLCVLSNPSSFGAIDILAAPIFTIWFNEWSVVYSIVLIIVNSLFWNFGIVKRLFKKDGESLSNPFLITMSIVFLIMIIAVPNNFRIIFSLN